MALLLLHCIHQQLSACLQAAHPHLPLPPLAFGLLLAASLAAALAGLRHLHLQLHACLRRAFHPHLLRLPHVFAALLAGLRKRHPQLHCHLQESLY
jgi:hypothetical protein